ncbi:MAG: C25 family cysteine peptidase [candidate division WOR-3 bacterium]
MTALLCRSRVPAARYRFRLRPSLDKQGNSATITGRKVLLRKKYPMRQRLILSLILALISTGFAFDGARYLVICRDEFVPAVTPLVEWRYASGFSCRLVRLSETGTDTAAVRNYIVNAYRNWPVKPEYVLLVADPAFLRAKIYGSGPTRYYSDNYYGDVTGDFRAELAVGRLPAKTIEQCERLVNKVLAYEVRPDTTGCWMQRLTTIVREDGDTDDSIYWANVRYAAALAGSAGFLGCDSLSYFRGHNAQDVVNSVNAGTGFVLYRGRGSGNWYSPFAVDPGQCNNGTRLPIVLSITCETMALDPYDSMAGQAWMLAAAPAILRGAAAFFGNTHSDNDVAAKRSPVARGFFSGLFGAGRYRLGDAALQAKAQLYQEYPDTLCREDYRGFNIFGDPAMALWTATPKRIDVTHPAEVLVGPHDIVVTVTSRGSPVPGATACASMDTTVHVFGPTDHLGRVTLRVNPADTGQMRLVVSGQNLYPYNGVIHVVTEVGVGEQTRAPVTPVLACQPNPFRTRTAVRSPAAADMSGRIGIYDASGRCVKVLAISHASAVTVWDGRDASGRTVQPGVYIVQLEVSPGRVLARSSVTRLR